MLLINKKGKLISMGVLRVLSLFDGISCGMVTVADSPGQLYRGHIQNTAIQMYRKRLDSRRNCPYSERNKR